MVGDDGHRHTDLLIGILVAFLFTIVDAVSIGVQWQVVPAGILAGKHGVRGGEPGP